jgi:hypothetical protein
MCAGAAVARLIAAKGKPDYPCERQLQPPSPFRESQAQ